jgi:hypothetical protein
MIERERLSGVSDQDAKRSAKANLDDNWNAIKVESSISVCAEVREKEAVQNR